jgi:hypothetical protein
MGCTASTQQNEAWEEPGEVSPVQSPKTAEGHAGRVRRANLHRLRYKAPAAGAAAPARSAAGDDALVAFGATAADDAAWARRFSGEAPAITVMPSSVGQPSLSTDYMECNGTATSGSRGGGTSHNATPKGSQSSRRSPRAHSIFRRSPQSRSLGRSHSGLTVELLQASSAREVRRGVDGDNDGAGGGGDDDDEDDEDAFESPGRHDLLGASRSKTSRPVSPPNMPAFRAAITGDAATPRDNEEEGFALPGGVGEHSGTVEDWLAGVNSPTDGGAR